MLDTSWDSTMHQIEVGQMMITARQLGELARHYYVDSGRLETPPSRDDNSINNVTDEAWDAAWASIQIHDLGGRNHDLPKADEKEIWNAFLSTWFGETTVLAALREPGPTPTKGPTG